jgi:outer membrane murein-binding lipoprotein Lpp
MRNAILGALVSCGVLLAGCAANSPSTSLAATCQGYASALGALADYKAEMSSDQKTTVEVVRATLNPICFERNFDSYDQALLAVADGLEKLATIKKDVE